MLMGYVSYVRRHGTDTLLPTVTQVGHDTCFVVQSSLVLSVGVLITQKFSSVYDTVVAEASDARADAFARRADATATGKSDVRSKHITKNAGAASPLEPASPRSAGAAFRAQLESTSLLLL
jgi:hypothetical protein